jgi:hypothetical protein
MNRWLQMAGSPNASTKPSSPRSTGSSRASCEVVEQKGIEPSTSALRKQIETRN